MASSIFASLLPSYPICLPRSSFACSSIYHSLRNLSHPCLRYPSRSFAIRPLPDLNFTPNTESRMNTGPRSRPDTGPRPRPDSYPRNRSQRFAPQVDTTPRVEEKLGVKVEKNPDVYRLADLRVWTWEKWECEASKVPVKYENQEMCYMLRGKVRVYPEGSSEYVEFASGDLVTLPKGMNCTWDILQDVDKYYKHF